MSAQCERSDTVEIHEKPRERGCKEYSRRGAGTQRPFVVIVSPRRHKSHKTGSVRLSRNIAVVCVDYRGQCRQSYGPQSRSGPSPDRAVHVSPGQSEATPRVTWPLALSRAESPLQAKRNPTGGIAILEISHNHRDVRSRNRANQEIGDPGRGFLHKTRRL